MFPPSFRSGRDVGKEICESEKKKKKKKKKEEEEEQEQNRHILPILRIIFLSPWTVGGQDRSNLS